MSKEGEKTKRKLKVKGLAIYYVVVIGTMLSLRVFSRINLMRPYYSIFDALFFTLAIAGVDYILRSIKMDNELINRFEKMEYGKEMGHKKKESLPYEAIEKEAERELRF